MRMFECMSVFDNVCKSMRAVECVSESVLCMCVYVCMCSANRNLLCCVCACDVVEAHCCSINMRQDRLRSNCMTSSYKGYSTQLTSVVFVI